MRLSHFDELYHKCAPAAVPFTVALLRQLAKLTHTVCEIAVLKNFRDKPCGTFKRTCQAAALLQKVSAYRM